MTNDFYRLGTFGHGQAFSADTSGGRFSVIERRPPLAEAEDRPRPTADSERMIALAVWFEELEMCDVVWCGLAPER